MPYAIDLEAGKEYWFCTCGKSGTGLCNGAHQVTDKTPHHFIATKNETVYICGCGETFNSPFCDGTHKASTQGVI